MALFDKSANAYDAWYKNPIGKFVDMVETDCLFSLADDISGKKVLDLGCGTGHLSEILHARDANVTGIDISDGMLQKARTQRDKLGLDIDYKNMNVYDLAFGADTFDHVFSMAAVEFIPNIALAFKNVAKVLKTGGSAVIGTIHKGSAWTDMYGSEAFAQTVFANACFKQLDDFRQLDGFEMTDVKECLFVPPGLGEDAYTYDNETKQQKSGKKGGFLCVKMKRI